MSINRRGTSFLATVHHDGKRWRRQFETNSEAELWEAQAKVDLLSGRTPSTHDQVDSPQVEPTLDSLIAYTAEHEWSDKKSSKGLHQNALLVGEALGLETDVRSILKGEVDAVVSKFREQGNSNATINRKCAALSKVLTTAVHLGIIDKKPRIKRLREAEHRRRWYTDAELTGILDYLKGEGSPEMQALIRFLADTGLRVSEALNLEWRDVTVDETGSMTTVTVHESKSGSPRSVPLTFEAGVSLWQCLPESAKYGDQRLHPKEGGPFTWCTKSRLRWWWAKIRKHMGWEDDPQAVVHALRHTFISRLVQNGVPIITVKELAGHKNIEVTMGYAHLAPHNLKSAIATLSKLDDAANHWLQ